MAVHCESMKPRNVRRARARVVVVRSAAEPSQRLQPSNPAHAGFFRETPGFRAAFALSRSCVRASGPTLFPSKWGVTPFSPHLFEAGRDVDGAGVGCRGFDLHFGAGALEGLLVEALHDLLGQETAAAAVHVAIRSLGLAGDLEA